MHALLVVLSLLLASGSAIAQNETVAPLARGPYYDLNFDVAWSAYRNRPTFGLSQELDLDQRTSAGLGITRYWPLNDRSDLSLGIVGQYIPSDVNRVLNLPPFTGAANVSGLYNSRLVYFEAGIRNQFALGRNVIYALYGAGVGVAFDELKIFNPNGTLAASGSATVLAWKLQGALLLKLSDLLMFGPFVEYQTTGGWNGTLPGGIPVRIGSRQVIRAGVALRAALDALSSANMPRR